MIVMATNVGHDVAGGQFDIMIPGGGVGLYNACSDQWGVTNAQLGKTYGGLLSTCKEADNYQGSMEDYKSCVRQKCQAIFNTADKAELMAGCNFFVDWMNAADNPTFKYKQVDCPQELKEGYIHPELEINW